MSQKARVLIVVGFLLLVAIAFGAYGLLAQQRMASLPPATPQPGMVHVYVDGAFVANVAPADLEKLPPASFNDLEEGKAQEGWWLRDVVRLYVKEGQLSPQSEIAVSGVRQASEAKTAVVTWAEALEPANNLAFDLAGDGQSMKLVSTMTRLSTRDQWVQGVNKIEIKTKP